MLENDLLTKEQKIKEFILLCKKKQIVKALKFYKQHSPDLFHIVETDDYSANQPWLKYETASHWIVRTEQLDFIQKIFDKDIVIEKWNFGKAHPYLTALSLPRRRKPDNIHSLLEIKRYLQTTFQTVCGEKIENDIKYENTNGQHSHYWIMIQDEYINSIFSTFQVNYFHLKDRNAGFYAILYDSKVIENIKTTGLSLKTLWEAPVAKLPEYKEACNKDSQKDYKDMFSASKSTKQDSSEKQQTKRRNIRMKNVTKRQREESNDSLIKLLEEQQIKRRNIETQLAEEQNEQESNDSLIKFLEEIQRRREINVLINNVTKRQREEFNSQNKFVEEHPMIHDLNAKTKFVEVQSTQVRNVQIEREQPLKEVTYDEIDELINNDPIFNYTSQINISSDTFERLQAARANSSNSPSL